MEKIIGNKAVAARLQRLLETGRVPHLLLFSGPDGVGKKEMARTFGAMWLKRTLPHPDLSVITPEGKTGMHSIASIRRFVDEITLTPFEAAGKVVIIDDAERMLPTSANTLLKTLEEPPKNSLIILVSSERERILPTIISRCQEIRFGSCSTEEVTNYLLQHHHPSHEDARKIALRAQGSIGKALRLCEKNLDDMETLLFDFLSTSQWKEYHRVAAVCGELQKLLEDKKKGKEQALRAEIGDALKEYTASQKQLVEQEIEGALSLLWMQDVTQILHDIVAYFRDLFALSCGEPAPFLYFQHKKEALVTAYNLGDRVSLDKLEPLIQEAKEAVERSTPLQHALERLFLQL